MASPKSKKKDRDLLDEMTDGNLFKKLKSGDIRFGFSIQATETSPEGERTSKKTEESKFDKYSDIQDSFITSLHSLLEYIKAIASHSNMTKAHNAFGFLIWTGRLVERARKKSPEDKQIGTITLIFEEMKEAKRKANLDIPIFDPQSLTYGYDFFLRQHAAERILYRSSLQFIANIFEQLLADLMKAHYEIHPASLPKDRQITYENLLNFSSMEDARQFIISEEVSKLLKSSTEAQLDLFDKHLKGKLKQHFPRLNDLTEVLLRRHVITHADGRVSREYLQRAGAIDKSYTNKLVLDQEMPLNQQYIEDAWSLVYSCGVIMVELCWKHAAGSLSDEVKNADSKLIESGFEALKSGCNQAAEVIFRYGQESRTDEASRLISVINYCIALRAQDKPYLHLVGKQAWSTRNVVFQLAAAVLRDEMAEFSRLLPVAAKDESNGISLNELYEWPLFQWLRKRSDFEDIVRAHFGDMQSLTFDAKRFSVLLPPEQPVKSRTSARRLRSQRQPKTKEGGKKEQKSESSD